MSLISLHEAFPVFRVPVAPWLPAGWRRDILECTRTYQEMRYLDGGSVTSRQRQLGNYHDYIVGVVQAKVVADQLPWLWDFYHGTVLDLANSASIGNFVCSQDVRSSININCLPLGSCYEWHVDSNPLTGLLFVTDHPVGDGGELVFRPDPVTRPHEQWELVVQPRSGDLLLFDAREAAHHVQRVLGGTERVTVTMNLYLADQGISRPDDLDDYLYGN